MTVTDNVRPAVAGELCTCGRPAATVYTGGRFGDTGDCGLGDGGAPVDGVCTFCGDTVDHAHYWAQEQAAGRPAAGHDDATQGGRCPLYRLRLTDPLPRPHPTSVRPYDPATDRRDRADGRLRRELLEVLLAAGMPYDGTYELADDAAADAAAAVDDDVDDVDDNTTPETGNLDDVVFDIAWSVRQALAGDPHEATSHHPEAGQPAVGVLVVLLRERLDEAGVRPHPLTGLDAAALIDRAGGQQAWCQTVAHDRPLLITRRVVRRALNPETPIDIYRPWWS